MMWSTTCLAGAGRSLVSTSVAGWLNLNHQLSMRNESINHHATQMTNKNGAPGKKTWRKDWSGLADALFHTQKQLEDRIMLSLFGHVKQHDDDGGYSSWKTWKEATKEMIHSKYH